MGGCKELNGTQKKLHYFRDSIPRFGFINSTSPFGYNEKCFYNVVIYSRSQYFNLKTTQRTYFSYTEHVTHLFNPSSWEAEAGVS